MIARAAFLAGTVAIVATIAQAADPFYLRLLREGTDAYNRRDFVAAERQLRVACFGLLDEPELLADGLIRLSLAQAAAGDTAGFAETFQRVAEVEERYAGFSKAAIPRDVREAFSREVVALIPRSTLAERPAIAKLIPVGADHTAKATPPPPAPAATATPTRPPAPTRAPTAPAVASPAAPPPNVTPVTTRVATPVRGSATVPAATPASPRAAEPVVAAGSLTNPPPVPASTPAATPTSPARRKANADEQREMDAAQELVRKNRVGDALQRARKLADAEPELAEAQFLAAELAYRTLRFPEAAAYFRRGGDPGDARPLLLFYEAVSRYETGDRDGAAVVLRRALPNIRRTAYVEGYVSKILGAGAEHPQQP